MNPPGDLPEHIDQTLGESHAPAVPDESRLVSRPRHLLEPDRRWHFTRAISLNDRSAGPWTAVPTWPVHARSRRSPAALAPMSRAAQVGMEFWR